MKTLRSNIPSPGLEEVVFLYIFKKGAVDSDLSYELFPMFYLKNMPPSTREPLSYEVSKEMHDDLLQRVSRIPQSNEEAQEIGRLLYTYFMPNEMREEIRDLRPEYICIVTNDNNIPWELTYDGDDFWCMKYAFGRIFADSSYRSPRITKNAKAKFSEELGALIIANPSGNLPAASREARSVESYLRRLAKHLEKQPKITRLEYRNATYQKISAELPRSSWDIIHYAGHLIVEENQANVGIDLDGRPLMSSEIKQINWRDIPPPEYVAGKRPIVFCNGCGTASEYFGEQNASLASSFIRAGASAYVGTLWAVEDGPSKDFANSFYSETVQGMSFGKALQKARRSIRKKHSGTHWAPYILYGIPSRMYDISSYSQRYELYIKMSDKPGTYSKILDILYRQLHVNVISSRTDTVLEGKDAVAFVEIRLPAGMPFDSLRVKLLNAAKKEKLIKDVKLILT